MKNKIINNPDQWIITRNGDFVRIKDNLISVEESLEKIREHLKKSYKGVVRFQGKTPEQISKERYDKVLEEVNFDYNKLHEWIYDEKNKEKVEIIKQKELSEKDFWEAVSAVFNHVSSSITFESGIYGEEWNTKWRIKNTTEKILVNEETGQVIYDGKGGIIFGPSLLAQEKIKDYYSIIPPIEIKPKEKHTATLIFLHGTYGAGSLDNMAEKFPGLKVIYPYSPTLQYDMWHNSKPAPGGQCKGWINITGDAWEIMEQDVCPNNPQINYDKADQSIHLDYPQLMQAAAYVNEIIEREIASEIPPEKIFVSGYSQGGLLTLAVALTSQHKLGGFISLCGLLPRRDKLLVIAQDKNKKTPILIINNSQDPWIPFWTGKKTYEILKNRDYNVEFKTRPGLGHSWKNEDLINFLGKCLSQKTIDEKHPIKQKNEKTINSQKKLLIGAIFSLVIILIIFGAWLFKKNKKQ